MDDTQNPTVDPAVDENVPVAEPTEGTEAGAAPEAPAWGETPVAPTADEEEKPAEDAPVAEE